MATKPATGRPAKPTSLHVRKGDTVQVIAGKDRGATGKVILTMPKARRVLVEGVNRIKKHTKVTTTARGAQSGGIVTQEAPVHASNVMVVCPKCDKPSRIGSRQEEYTDERTGRVRTRPVRVCKRCGNEF
jgi:large subunit ribosomal protein L24